MPYGYPQANGRERDYSRERRDDYSRADPRDDYNRRGSGGGPSPRQQVLVNYLLNVLFVGMTMAEREIVLMTQGIVTTDGDSMVGPWKLDSSYH